VLIHIKTFCLVGLQNYCSIGALGHAQLCSVCDPAHSNWMKKGQKNAGWLRKTGFATANLYSLLTLVVYGAAMMCTTPREECNKYDMTATPCF